MSAYRRVITGLDDQGRSCVAIEGPPVSLGGLDGGHIWRSAVPADNSGRDDIRIAPPFTYDWFHEGLTNFMVIEMPAGTGTEDGGPYMHATDTIDYAVILGGEVTLVLETGETTLRAGDFVVDRGVLHGWRNDGAEKSVMAVITVPAHPVGKGKTV